MLDLYMFWFLKTATTVPILTFVRPPRATKHTIGWVPDGESHSIGFGLNMEGVYPQDIQVINIDLGIGMAGDDFIYG